MISKPLTAEMDDSLRAFVAESVLSPAAGELRRFRICFLQITAQTNPTIGNHLREVVQQRRFLLKSIETSTMLYGHVVEKGTHRRGFVLTFSKDTLVRNEVYYVEATVILGVRAGYSNESQVSRTRGT